MKNLTILTIAASALVLATACSKPETDVQVSGVELDRETLTLNIGDGGDLTATLTAIVAPTGATNKAVMWSSSRPDIATVDANGKVTAVAGGEAQITVTTKDGGKEDSCTVTVDDKINPPDPINLLDPKYIPDAEFLKYCEGQMTVWNTDGYDGLSLDEAAAVKTMSIADIGAVRLLKGMELFTGLEALECRNLNNNLTVLDLTKNAALRKLICTGDALTRLNVSGCAALESLDVSGCPNLNELNCFSNCLAALDVSKCLFLTFLNVEGNRLKELDVSQNTRLRTLFCNGNMLEELDVSHNEALESLDAAGNDFDTLDVSNNPSLTLLKCSNNGLTTLNVSNCAALKSLACYGNELTVLDVSKCTEMTSLDCYDNSLEELDLSNNPSLTLLQCSDNSISSLDVSKCAALTDLDCYGNSLTALDLTGNKNLYSFSCGDNELSTLTVRTEEYKDLSYFDCRNNDLDAEQLNAIFNALPDTGPEGPTYPINISYNPGVAECCKNIAEEKNWTVVKDLLRKR